MKECTTCKLMKPLSEFHRSSRVKSGYVSACKSCESIRGRKKYDPLKNKIRYEEKKDEYLATQKEYYKNNKARIQQRSKDYYNRNLEKWLESGWKQKGILNREGKPFTKIDHMKELERTSGLCEICKSDGTLHKKGLCVDHDHDTGIVRGILCAHCNSAIGHFHDDINKLTNAICYLNSNAKKHP